SVLASKLSTVTLALPSSPRSAVPTTSSPLYTFNVSVILFCLLSDCPYSAVIDAELTSASTTTFWGALGCIWFFFCTFSKYCFPDFILHNRCAFSIMTLQHRFFFFDSFNFSLHEFCSSII